VSRDSDHEPIDIRFKGVFLETFKQNFLLGALQLRISYGSCKWMGFEWKIVHKLRLQHLHRRLPQC
jgi:hypothetical protein